MHVEVRLYSGLEKHVQDARYGKPIELNLPAGTTAKRLIEQLGIPREQVFSILVNGSHRKDEDLLEDGDRIALFPPVGGG